MNFEEKPKVSPAASVEKEGKEKTGYATERWFKAYVEGNLRLPQDGFGFYSTLSNAVLAEPEPSFRKFHHSRLSPEQAKSLLEVMERSHTKQEVPVGVSLERASNFKGTGKDFEVIGETRIQKLWSSAKDGSVHLVGRLEALLRDGSDISPVTIIDLPKLAAELDDTLYSPEGEEVLAKLRRIATHMIDSLRSEEGRELTDEYQKLFSHGYRTSADPGYAHFSRVYAINQIKDFLAKRICHDLDDVQLEYEELRNRLA